MLLACISIHKVKSCQACIVQKTATQVGSHENRQPLKAFFFFRWVSSLPWKDDVRLWKDIRSSMVKLHTDKTLMSEYLIQSVVWVFHLQSVLRKSINNPNITLYQLMCTAEKTPLLANYYILLPVCNTIFNKEQKQKVFSAAGMLNANHRNVWKNYYFLTNNER